jgi:SAM-dependent methyltransferase
MLPFLQTLNLEGARESLLAKDDLTEAERTWLRGIQSRVHKKERSYLENGGEHYLQVGLSAVRCIEAALAESKIDPPNSLLDFPCGFGRVLRFLKAAYPDASIQAAELDSTAVKFCNTVFKVSTYLSRMDLTRLQLNESFDLVWCGSLVTHFDHFQIRELLAFFSNHLNPGGLCVFTSHGKTVAELLESGRIHYSLKQEQINSVLKQYQSTGMGFTEYEPSRNGYGISLTSDEKIRQLASEAGNWECQLHIPAGWDNHQDVYSFCKHA